MVFTGDALGVHLPQVAILHPAAPPPEFDVDQAVASIQRIRLHARGSLMFSHFGPLGSIDDTCTEAIRRIKEWSEIVRMAMTNTRDVGRMSSALRRATSGDLEGVSPADRERFEILGSYDMNAAGLFRYWSKRTDPGPS